MADYAGLNVRRCRFEHDCHNTPKFNHSGQNLFFQTATGDDAEFKDINSFIEEAIVNSWWEKEVAIATQANIDSCCGTKERPHHMINHFLQMAHSKSNFIGCAIAQYSDDDGKTSYMVCNYSHGIVDKQKVYETGHGATKCHSGHNPKFPALCSVNEIVDIHHHTHHHSQHSQQHHLRTH